MKHLKLQNYFLQKEQKFNNKLIHPFSTVLGSTSAWNLVIILEIKLVIIRELLSSVYPPGSKDDDVSVRQLYSLGHTVGVAAVVDVPRHAPRHGGVHHPLIIQPEHVDAAVLVLVVLLPDVSQVGPDHLADVLDDHLTLLQVPGGVQPQSLDLGPGQHNILSPLLLHLPVLRRLALNKVLAVRTDCLETNEERDHVLGSSVQIFLGSSRSLEVVNPLDVSSELLFRSCTASGVHSQRKLQHWIA